MNAPKADQEVEEFYGGSSNTKKFSIVFNLTDEDERNLYRKLMRISPQRRAYLVMDILMQYFNRGTSFDQLINAVENLTIHLKHLEAPQVVPAVAVGGGNSEELLRMIRQTQEMLLMRGESQKISTSSVPHRVTTEGHGAPSFVDSGVDIAALAEAAAAEELQNHAENPAEVPLDMDALAMGVFSAGVQRREE